MAIVVFSYVLSIHKGLKSYHTVRVRIFTDQQSCKVESVFWYGINQIAQHCLNWTTFLLFVTKEIRTTKHQYRSHNSIIV